MLHVISYDMKGKEADYPTLYRVIEQQGEPFYCLESTVFVHSTKSAGAIDSALRAEFEDGLNYVVIDITGIDVEKYFGSIKRQDKLGSFWDWISQNNF